MSSSPDTGTRHHRNFPKQSNTIPLALQNTAVSARASTWYFVASVWGHLFSIFYTCFFFFFAPTNDNVLPLPNKTRYIIVCHYSPPVRRPRCPILAPRDTVARHNWNANTFHHSLRAYVEIQYAIFPQVSCVVGHGIQVLLLVAPLVPVKQRASTLSMRFVLGL